MIPPEGMNWSVSPMVRCLLVLAAARSRRGGLRADVKKENSQAFEVLKGGDGPERAGARSPTVPCRFTSFSKVSFEELAFLAHDTDYEFGGGGGGCRDAGSAGRPFDKFWPNYNTKAALDLIFRRSPGAGTVPPEHCQKQADTFQEISIHARCQGFRTQGELA